MKLLFVHQHRGALGGAEANIHLTATELQSRGHKISLLHGSSTGKSEDLWRATFEACFALKAKNNRGYVRDVVDDIQPDVIYLHNMADLEVLEAVMDSEIPVVRMV